MITAPPKSLFIIHYSLFISKYSLLIIHYSLFIILLGNLFAQDFQRTDIDTTSSVPAYEFSLPKNPTKAALLSAALPGAGQFYNEKYVKGSLVIGIQTGLVLRALHWDKEFKKYRSRYNAAEEGSIEQAINRQKYIDTWESRQNYIFWVGFTVLLSTMDAYVDAHLINFKAKKNEIHLKFEGEMIVLSVKF